MAPKEFYLPQGMETQFTSLAAPCCEIRYAYARSGETQEAQEKGQDALCFRTSPDEVYFALCDGVSMSFMGDLAASFLSQELVRWLADLDLSRLKGSSFSDQLTCFLTDLTSPGTRMVSAYVLPPDLLGVIRSVLEEKRAMGSESMFVCGKLDFQAEKAALAWMGDSRLRLWRKSREQTTQEFGKTFITRERWSSRRGCLGPVHAWQSDFKHFTRLAAYSDGLSILDGKMDGPYAVSTLNELLQAVSQMPNSDDCSYFEIILPGDRMIL
jgi:hypothetical protein